MEPLNVDMLWDPEFLSFVERLSSFRGYFVQSWYIWFVLCLEVCSVLYWRFHCIQILGGNHAYALAIGIAYALIVVFMAVKFHYIVTLSTTTMYYENKNTYRNKVRASEISDDPSTSTDPHVTNEGDKPPRYKTRWRYKYKLVSQYIVGP